MKVFGAFVPTRNIPAQRTRFNLKV